MPSHGKNMFKLKKERSFSGGMLLQKKNRKGRRHRHTKRKYCKNTINILTKTGEKIKLNGIFLSCLLIQEMMSLKYRETYGSKGGKRKLRKTNRINR